MRLLDGGGWDEPTLLSAAVAFAGTKRFPGYFEEWASEVLTRADIAAHEARKADENTPLPLAVLAAILRGQKTVVAAKPKTYKCLDCGWQRGEGTCERCAYLASRGIA